MNGVQKIIIFSLFLGAYAPAHGMWRSFVAKAALNKKVFATAALSTSAGIGIGYAKQDDIATLHQKSLVMLHACSKLPTHARMYMVKEEKFKSLRHHFPLLCQLLITDPLLKKIRYTDLSTYVYEDKEDTQYKQTIARTLCTAGVPLEVSPTQADLLAYDNNQKKKGQLSNAFSNIRISLFNEMLQEEQAITQRGHQVLYHGTDASTYAADYIGTKLQTIEQDSKDSSFLCLRQTLSNNVKDLEEQQPFYTRWWQAMRGTTPPSPTQEELDKKIREKLITRKSFEQQGYSGRLYFDLKDSLDNIDYLDDLSFLRRYLISCSPALASGTGFNWQGESALQRMTYKRIRDTQSFDTHAVPHDIMQVYRYKLQQLQSDLCRKTSSGIMFQISLSPELVEKTVYPSLPYGYKHAIYTKETPPKPFKTTSDIFAEMRDNPFNVHAKVSPRNCSGIDPMQFRLVVDKSLLLDPNNPEVRDGFKVKAFACDKEALKEFHQGVDGIVAQIRTEMQSRR